MNSSSQKLWKLKFEIQIQVIANHYKLVSLISFHLKSEYVDLPPLNSSKRDLRVFSEQQKINYGFKKRFFSFNSALFHSALHIIQFWTKTNDSEFSSNVHSEVSIFWDSMNICILYDTYLSNFSTTYWWKSIDSFCILESLIMTISYAF